MLALALAPGCSRAPGVSARYALLPFDNLTGDASLNWIAHTAPGIVAAELAGTARPVASVGDGYLEQANRFVHGYFTKSANTLQLHVDVEDAVTHKMVSADRIDGPVLADVNTLAKRLDAHATAFSTTNEAAVAAWGDGDYEKAVALDPAFGSAWLSWIETLAREGDAAGAIEVAGRALDHPVNSEVDGLRIALVRAQLEKDPHAEHDALLKLTARVSDPQLLAQLGALEVRFRDFGLAQGDYKKLLAAQPQNADAMNQLGYAYGFDGKIPEAEAIYAEYGKLPGQQANAFDSLGEVYFMNGKFAAAEKAFLHAHELNPAFLSGSDLRKAAYARWLAGDLPGADQLFGSYLQFRAKLKDNSIEWQHAAWEYTTGRKDQAIARLQKASFPQAAMQVRVWQNDLKIPADPAKLKQAYEATTPAADGLFRTLYASALLAQGHRDEAKELAARWPLPDSAGETLLQSLVFPQYLALRRMLNL